MKNHLRFAHLSCLLAAVLLAGCATTTPEPKPVIKHAPVAPKPPPPPPEPPPPEQPKRDQLALDDGIKLYTDGNYNAAIKLLGSSDDIWKGGTVANQLIALKYTAFSYCVTGRKVLCRKQFEKAFKLDPGFNLEPGENGHPLWGPVFVQAKKNSQPKTKK